MTTLIGSDGQRIEVGTADPQPATILVPIQGRDGTSITVGGVVATYANLPTGLGLADKGLLYVVQADNLGYVWSGAAWPANGEGLQVRGPQGVSVDEITISGNNLVFALTEGPDQSVLVPALVQSSTDAAAAQAAKAGAETARSGAESAKTAAETARTAAQTAKTGAETARTGAEAARTGAESAQSSATSSQSAAAGSATAAAGSATAASGSATTATTAAATATGARDETVTARDAAQASAATALTAADEANADATAADIARIAAEAAAENAENAGGVATTRRIDTGTGLTGGGDLTADRSHAVDFGTGAGKVTEGNDSRLSDARTPLPHAHEMSDVNGLVPATTTTQGLVKLAGHLTGTADVPTIAALAVGTANIATGAVTKAKTDAGVQASLGKADTASQPGHAHAATDISDATTVGRLVLKAADAAAARTAIAAAPAATSVQAGMIPADICFVHTGDSTRKTGLGGNASGARIARPTTYTALTVDLATADASGVTTVVVKKNGVAVSGMTVSITAPALTASVTGTWAYSAGDVLTVEITAIGTTPGKGCTANIVGVC